MAVPFIAAKAAMGSLDKTLDTAMKGAIALSAMGGTFFLIRHLVNSTRGQMVDDKALDAGQAPYYATLIGSTLNSGRWFGDLMFIDRENLYRIFRSIPPDLDFEKIKNAFFSRYQVSLTDELERKLTTEEYRKIVSIINYG